MPIAKERLETRPDGLVRITLKRTYADDTGDHDPPSLLCRPRDEHLAAPLPQSEVRGVLANASPWRPRIAPKPRVPEKAGVDDEPKRGRGASTYRPPYWKTVIMRDKAMGDGESTADGSGGRRERGSRHTHVNMLACRHAFSDRDPEP
jgi:hypothetical protein